MSTNPITARIEVRTGKDDTALITVLRLRGRESIGRCFELHIVGSASVAACSQGLPLDEIIGARCTLFMERVEDDGKTKVLRTIHGMIATIEDGLEARGGRYLYELLFVPRLWELGNLVTQEIFVGLTVPQIIRAKLGAVGMVDGEDFVLRLADEDGYRVDAATLPDRHADGAKDPAPAEPRLIVQFRESDLAFLSRLCEDQGISFFFEHDGDRDRVVFTDAPSGFTAHKTPVPYSDEGHHGSIRRVARRLRSVPSSIYLLDYNYRAPDLTLNDPATGDVLFESLGAKAEIDAQTPGSVVEFAPNVKTQPEADRLAAIRADEQESARERLVARSDLPFLAAGLRIQIANHPRLTTPLDDVVIVSVDHELATQEGKTGGHGESTEFSNGFEAVAAAKQLRGRISTYRPERTTPKPRIHGLLTGVVRAAGQLDHLPGVDLVARQHLDTEGRYLVRLHFDQGDSVMPRIRMAQPHAGESYGMHFPLRPGTEVVVAFLDGDPDRPMIVGAVPNPLHRAPVRQEPGAVVEALLHMNEMNRIETRSGCIIQIGDGDPGLLSVP